MVGHRYQPRGTIASLGYGIQPVVTSAGVSDTVASEGVGSVTFAGTATMPSLSDVLADVNLSLEIEVTESGQAVLLMDDCSLWGYDEPYQALEFVRSKLTPSSEINADDIIALSVRVAKVAVAAVSTESTAKFRVQGGAGIGLVARVGADIQAAKKDSTGRAWQMKAKHDSEVPPGYTPLYADLWVVRSKYRFPLKKFLDIEGLPSARTKRGFVPSAVDWIALNVFGRQRITLAYLQALDPRELFVRLDDDVTESPVEWIPGGRIGVPA